jgi:hypothetical protein
MALPSHHAEHCGKWHSANGLCPRGKFANRASFGELHFGVYSGYEIVRLCRVLGDLSIQLLHSFNSVVDDRDSCSGNDESHEKRQGLLRLTRPRHHIGS